VEWDQGGGESNYENLIEILTGEGKARSSKLNLWRIKFQNFMAVPFTTFPTHLVDNFWRKDNISEEKTSISGMTGAFYASDFQ
jgi:hypothetical protein